MARRDDGLEVVHREARDRRPVAERPRIEHATRVASRGARVARRGEPAIRLRRVDGEWWQHEQDLALLGSAECEQSLAAPPRQSERARGGEERDVGAQSRSDGEQRGLADRRRCDGIERSEHRARIRAPAAEPSTDRDALRQLDREAGGPPGRRGVRLGGTPREIALGGAEQTWVDLAVDVEGARTARRADEQVVGEGEPEKQRLELMVSRRLAREDAQTKVHFGLGGDADRVRPRSAGRGHRPEAAGAEALPLTGGSATGGSTTVRCAPLISPIDSPARRKYHAP